MESGHLSKIFHLQTAEVQRTNVPSETDLWPEEWKKVFYKEYPRFQKIKLTYQENYTTNILDTLRERASCRTFDQKRQISFDDLGTLLKYGIGVQDKKYRTERRTYPSGGARYPIEVYLSVQNKAVESLTEGLYHYQFKDHSLEFLENFESLEKNVRTCVTYEWARHAPVIFIFTSVWWRSSNKYKEFAYHLTLLETGHMAQNILLLGAALGLGFCPLAGLNKKESSKVLDLELSAESPLYALAMGLPAINTNDLTEV